MKTENENRNNQISRLNIENLALSLGISALFLFILSLAFDVTYEINDDAMIVNILSGEIFNMNSASFYLSIELGGLLRLLYTLFPHVSWYGIMLISCYGIGLFLILFRTFSFFEKRKYKILSAVLVLITFTALFFRYCVLIHYTVTAAFAGAVGIALFVTSDIEKNKKSLYCSIVLFYLCYLIRENVGFMLQPFIFIAFIFLILRDKISSFKKYLPYILIYFIGLILLILINRVLPGNEEWSNYKDYNDLRTTVYDYVLINNDEEKAMEYYRQKGLSDEDIALYDSYNVMLDNEDSVTKLKIFADYENVKNEGIGTIQKVKSAIYSYVYRITKERRDGALGNLAIILYILSVVCIIITRKYRYLIIPIFSILYRSAFWSFLYYKGRYPDRVLIALFFMEIMLLLTLIYEILRDNKVNPRLKLYIYVATIAIMAAVLAFQLKSFRVDYEKQLSVNKTADVLYLYLDSHPENYYFLDVFSVCNYTEKAVSSDDIVLFKDKGMINRKNRIILGGWIMNHPEVNKLYDSFGVSNAAEAIIDKGCMLVSEKNDGPDKKSFEKWIGHELESVDEIVADDKVFVVYKVSE